MFKVIKFNFRVYKIVQCMIGATAVLTVFAVWEEICKTCIHRKDSCKREPRTS